MSKSEAVWFLSAFFVQLAVALASFSTDTPSPFQWASILIGAVAQGFIAWRAFVGKPPTDAT